MLESIPGTAPFMMLLALFPPSVAEGWIWQVFTYGFLHQPQGILALHLFFNMYGVWLFGVPLVQLMGTRKFYFLYFLCQLGGGLLVFITAFLTQNMGNVPLIGNSWIVPTLGASAAVFGLATIFGFAFPNAQLFLLFFPIRAANLAMILLFSGVILDMISGSHISHMAHLGGILTALFLHTRWNKEAVSKAPSISSKEPEAPEEGKIAKSNLALVQKLREISEVQEKEEFLLPKQVQDANICPSNTFDIKDDFCLQCEWFANCSLRRIRETGDIDTKAKSDE